jgi:MOSC domain-containing protein YiiM
MALAGCNGILGVSDMNFEEARIVAVSARRGHHFSKAAQLSVRLVAGLGVEGDAHMGELVKHRYDARKDPTRPNLRQVHLIDTGYTSLMAERGFVIGPGDIGDNMLVDGIDLIALPADTRLRLGSDGVVIRLTGLRHPCSLMDRFLPGLMAASLDRDDQGALIRRSGVMAVVERGGDVRPGDIVLVELPPQPWQPLEPV